VVVGEFGAGLAVSELSPHRAVMHSQHQSRNVAFNHGTTAWAIEDEQCQKVGGGYRALMLRFLLFL
jgi:hypothetical protein